MKTDQITLYSINRLLHCPSNYSPPAVAQDGSGSAILDYETHNSVSSRLLSDLHKLKRTQERAGAVYFRSLDAAVKFLKDFLDQAPISYLRWSNKTIADLGCDQPVSWMTTAALPVDLVHTQESYSTGSLQYELVFHRTLTHTEDHKATTLLPPYPVAFVVEPHTFTIADLP